MNANDLLLWISAKKSGTWAGYKAMIEEMATLTEDDAEENEDGDLPFYQRARFNLERLGHAEFLRPGFPKGWRVVPPTLAGISGQPVAILCGARTDELVARMQQLGARTTPQPECPDRIELEVKNDLERVAAENGFLSQRDATEALLAAAPPIDNWQFRAPRELPFGNDAPVSRFSTASLEWTPSSAEECRRTSFGLFRWQLPYERQYYLKDRNRSYRVPVQLGKYVALRTSRRRILTFDRVNEVLSVPVTCRPPILVDRALTIRTGLLPDVQQGALVYQNISSSIAATAAALLRQ